MRIRYVFVISILMIFSSVFAQELPTPVAPPPTVIIPERVPVANYTTTQLYPVVVARQPIARGTAVTEAMLAVIQMPGDVLNDMLMMDNIFSASIYTETHILDGQFASVDIQPFQPITGHMIVPENPFGTLPWSKGYPAGLPVTHTATFLIEPLPGAQVDVLALTTFANVPHQVPVRLVNAAEILSADQESIIITMASQGDRVNLLQLTDAGVEMLLVPAGLRIDTFDLAAQFAQ